MFVAVVCYPCGLEWPNFYCPPPLHYTPGGCIAKMTVYENEFMLYLHFIYVHIQSVITIILSHLVCLTTLANGPTVSHPSQSSLQTTVIIQTSFPHPILAGSPPPHNLSSPFYNPRNQYAIYFWGDQSTFITFLLLKMCYDIRGDGISLSHIWVCSH